MTAIETIASPSRRTFMTTRALSLVLALVVLAAPLHAQSRGGGGRGGQRRSGPGTGDPEDRPVPWTFLQGDVVLHDKAINVYWIPASLQQAERSELMTSENLMAATTRCVDFEILLPERTAMVEKLGLTGKTPAALIVDRSGAVIRTGSEKDVVKMVSAELAARDEAMFREMTEADRQARAGNNAAAIDLYKKIWDDRCLFTSAGDEARRALKRLGVIVTEPPAKKAPAPVL
jgi:hypothetical protein